MNALEKVQAALEQAGSRKRGPNWNCPAHQDRTASLQVTPHKDKIGLYCHAGCVTEDIVHALGLEMGDLFDGERREVARYPYVDRDGEILFHKIRFENPKSFTLDRQLNGAAKPLYNLPDVLAAVAAGRMVWVVNGEKSAGRLREAGEVATCTAHGENGWRPEYGDVLRGADVTVVADRDDTGTRYAAEVCADLKRKACTVRIVQSATTGVHDDIADHLDAGHTLDMLVPYRVENEISSRYKRVDWHEAFSKEHSEEDWLYPPILQAGTVNVLFGKAGDGKSLLTLEIAMTLVREGKNVVYVDDENRVIDTVDRLRAFGCGPSELDSLSMYSFSGLPPLDTPEGGRDLLALAEVNDAALVILDTISRMVEGDENTASTYLNLYRNSLVPLKQRGITVLRIDHAGKEDMKGQRGSSAKAGDADAIWRLTLTEKDVILLTREKTRSGNAEPHWIRARRHEEPLRHVWEYLDQAPVSDRIKEMSAFLDRQGIPRDAGRPTLRAFIAKHDSKCSTTELALVARYRKALPPLPPGQVADSPAG